MNIEELKLKDLLALAAAFSPPQPQPKSETAFWLIGRKYFIRTVTHHHTGELVAITDQEVVLKDAAWIADDGRLTDALRSETFAEVELFPEGNVLIGREAIIDAVEIKSIPRLQK